MIVTSRVGAETANPYLRRMEEIEKLIDPDGRLPKVVLVSNSSAERPREFIPPLRMLILHEETTVGDCSIRTSLVTGESWFTGVRRLEQFKDRGLGIATYKLAIMSAVANGVDFRTHEIGLSEAAKRRWEKFASIGLAKVIEEFRLDKLASQKASYLGHYVIEAVPSETR